MFGVSASHYVLFIVEFDQKYLIGGLCQQVQKSFMDKHEKKEIWLIHAVF